MSPPTKCSLLFPQLLLSTALLLVIAAPGATDGAITSRQSYITSHQVSIRVRQPILGKIEDYHMCSGIIVDSQFVVTSANCILISHNLANDTELYIAAGHLVNGNRTQQDNFTVIDTIIHPSLLLPEPKAKRTDIALIKVAEQFPLASIVSIPNVQDSTVSCSVIVRNYDSTEYFKLSNSRLSPDSRSCLMTTANDDADEDDYYCTTYPMDSNWCEITGNQLRESPDLGSALICDNIFLGVLSEIQFPSDILFECGSPRRTSALFTSLDDNREWLYQVMGRIPVDPTGTDTDDEPDSALQSTASGVLVVVSIFAALRTVSFL